MILDNPACWISASDWSEVATDKAISEAGKMPIWLAHQKSPSLTRVIPIAQLTMNEGIKGNSRKLKRYQTPSRSNAVRNQQSSPTQSPLNHFSKTVPAEQESDRRARRCA